MSIELRNMSNLTNQNLLNEIKSWAYGIYRMNAKSAIGYAFNPAKYNKGIATGEYIYSIKSITRHSKEYKNIIEGYQYDYIVIYKNNVLCATSEYGEYNNMI